MPNNMYSLNDRVQIIQLFYASGGSYRSVTKQFNKNNPRGPKMSCNTVIRMIQKFESNGCLNAEHAVIKHPSRAIPEECRVEICEIAKREPGRSLRNISFDVGLSVSTVRRVLKEDNLSEYYRRIGKSKNPEELKEEQRDMKNRKLEDEVDDVEDEEDDEDDDFSDESEEESEEEKDNQNDEFEKKSVVIVKEEINYEDSKYSQDCVQKAESL